MTREAVTVLLTFALTFGAGVAMGTRIADHHWLAGLAVATGAVAGLIIGRALGTMDAERGK